MDLVGIAEIRAMLGGISRQRANVIASRRDFPAPAATLAMGNVWRRADVEAWIREHRPEQTGEAADGREEPGES